MLKNWPLKLLYIAIVLVAAAIIYKGWMIHEAKGDLNNTQFNEFSGAADAPIELIEFVDYRCSACRMKHKELKVLLEKNPDLKIIYRHYPVFGPQSADEAAMALGASLQGKFSEAHEYLISRELPVKPEDMPQMIRDIGLDRDQFLKQWRSPEIGLQIINNMDIAQLLGINATPTFLLNGKVIGDGSPKMPSMEELQAAIDNARKKL